ncbi:MAG: hypothetical protein GTN60_04845 [Pseudomonas stutzeri]|nr:hypothetical protein [Stutzerimonas stutzeri]NIM53844.1 hypothetical protein [Stutzerimonas stutzeri]NIM86150.1 hypothetical protein [Stutzerimonas stutzeri]NIN80746.1 hypothetical protein [Stutzerimonas stutzeri]NIO99992.1 hypothetical protein [Stutzerimonas stutzeri]
MWQDRLKFSQGEQLRHESSKVSGFMGEEDIDRYSVLNANGDLIGYVEHRCHTAVKGFRVTHTLVYKTVEGAVLIDEQWKG